MTDSNDIDGKGIDTMKIMLVSNMYPDADNPSYGVFVKNTEQILKESGHEVKRIVLTKKKNKWQKLFAYLFYYIKIVLSGLFNRNHIFYVHYAAHNSIPIIFLKKLRKNLVVVTNVHGSDVVPEVASQNKYQPYVKKLLHLSNIVITPSNYFKTLIIQKYSLHEEKINVFPSGGVNPSVFHMLEDKDRLYEEMNLNKNYDYIGFVSRIDVGKGWDIFLQSIDSLKEKGYFNNKKAIVVGNGKQIDQFWSFIKEKGLEKDILHHPLLPQRELNKLYNCMSVFCFPTTREGESLGLVGLEAMACGVPVIGSSIGGLVDYIHPGENGFLFEVGSSEDLTNKLIQFFQLTEEEQKQMRIRAKQTSEEYEVNQIKGKLLEIFNEKMVPTRREYDEN
jgi:L-malate glycosyltransferase